MIKESDTEKVFCEITFALKTAEIIQYNFVQGWSAEGFKKAEVDQAANKKTEVKPNRKDRIFSNSSVTSVHLFESTSPAK